MKKLMSIMLTVVMVMSLFAISSGAAPVATYETVDISVFTQDFQDATKAEWTKAYGQVNGYGRGHAEKVLETDAEDETNYVIDMKMNTEGIYNYIVLPGPTDAIEQDAYIIEFDACGKSPDTQLDLIVRNPYHSEIAPNGWLLRFVTATFGTEQKWYSFRVLVDFSGFEGTLANGNNKNFKVYWKERGSDADWALLTNQTSGNITANPSYRMLLGTSSQHDGKSVICFSCTNAGLTGTLANTNYQLDNINVYYKQEQLVDVVDGVIVAQDYEDVANNDAATKRENYGTATVMTEDGNSWLQMESTLGGSYYQGYTTLVNNGNFDLWDWEMSFDINRKSGNNAVALNFYAYNDDFAKGLTKNTDGTEVCMMLPSSEFKADTWYRVKFSMLPILGSDGVTKHQSMYVMKKNLDEDGDWEVANRIFYAGNPSNASGKIVIQLTAQDGTRPVEKADGKLNPTAAAGKSAEVNEAAVYWFDNFELTKDAKITVRNIIGTETEASATIDFSYAEKYATDDTYNVVMVAYDETGRVVDVALDAVAPVSGELEDVDLSVTRTEDVRVYVWETSTAKPLLVDVFDVDAWL